MLYDSIVKKTFLHYGLLSKMQFCCYFSGTATHKTAARPCQVSGLICVIRDQYKLKMRNPHIKECYLCLILA